MSKKSNHTASKAAAKSTAAAPRRVLRRKQVAQQASFEDQVWPVNLAILVLAGFLLGMILSTFKFSDTRIFHNAWTWTVALFIVVGTSIAVVASLDSRKIRRGVQLALVLSLILHIVLVIVGRQYFWYYLEKTEEDEDEIVILLVPPTELPRIPLLKKLDPNKTNILEKIEQRVQTKELENQQQETPRETTDVKPEVKQEPTITMDDQQKVTPLKNTKATKSNPTQRRSEQSSKSSKSQVSINRPTIKIKQTPKPQQSKTNLAKLNAAKTSNKRQKTNPLKQTNNNTKTPSTTQQNPGAIVMNRKKKTDPKQQAAATNNSNRKKRTNQSPLLPTTKIAVDNSAAKSPKSDPSKLSANWQTTQRQENTAPQVDTTANNTNPTTNQKIDASHSSRQKTQDKAQQIVNDSSNQPTKSNNAPPVVQQHPLVKTSPTAPAETPSNTPSQLKPTITTNAGRQNTTSTDLAADTAGDTKSTPSSTDTSVTNQNSQRNIKPSISQTVSKDSADQPTKKQAGLVTVDVAKAKTETNSNSSESEVNRQLTAAPEAHKRSQNGITGSGESKNLDNKSPASTRTSTLANSTARRQQRSRRNQADGALAATEESKIRGKQPSTQAPQVTFKANTTGRTDHHGTDSPTKLHQASNAAKKRNSSNAAPGNLNQETGTTQIDTGARQYATNKFNGTRSAGGGKPKLSISQGEQRLGNKKRGGPVAPTINPVKATQIAKGNNPGGSKNSVNKLASAQNSSTNRQKTNNPGTAAGGNTKSVAQSSGAVGPTSPTKSKRATTSPGSKPLGQLTASRSGGKKSGPPATAIIQSIVTTPSGNPNGSGNPKNSGKDGISGLLVSANQSGGPAQGTTVTGSESKANSTSVKISGDGKIESSEIAKSDSVGSKTGQQLSGTQTGAKKKSKTIGLITANIPTLNPHGLGGASPNSTDEFLPNIGELGRNQQGPTNRSGGGSVIADLQADNEGPGGLQDTYKSNTGRRLRSAKPDAQHLATHADRFPKKQVGGINIQIGKIKKPAAPFAGRKGNYFNKASQAAGGKPSSKTEKSVEYGLDFLARMQNNDGSWSFHKNTSGKIKTDSGNSHSDMAATGMVLLAFLGAGYDHYDDKYEQTVKKGLDWILKNQKKNGALYLVENIQRFYSHGIATMALCEAYGMTGDEKLKQPAQNAIDFIVESQDPKYGGWRYKPRFDSDTSVSGWQLTALKTAELAKLKVPKKVYQGVDKWLNFARVSPKSEGPRFAYRPQLKYKKKGNIYGKKATNIMTSVGLLMRLYTKWDNTNPQFIKGAAYLAQEENLPAIGTANNPKRNTYYWYYATQVMYHAGGEYWEKWNSRLHPMLIETQVAEGEMAGSWDPRWPVSDVILRTKPSSGRLYLTAMNLLSLEVQYRHLPMYKELKKGK